MKPESKIYKVLLGDSEITIETGKLALQAGGAVTVTIGETMIFAAATMDKQPKENTDFFPLTIDYEERMYAGGRIPGSFFRREGRPSTDAVLLARLTDRPLRPLFPNDMRNPVQIIMVSFSSDGINPIDILGINAASAALTISDIPWDGPVGAVRIGRIDGKFIVNPTFDQIDNSDLDLRVAGTKEAISMVECGANEIPDDVMVDALAFAHESIQPIIDLQLKMSLTLAMLINIIPLLAHMDLRSAFIATIPLGGVFAIITVAMIAFGELFEAARLFEFIGKLAPKGQEGLYMGYANLPMALGGLLGGPVGAYIFNALDSSTCYKIPVPGIMPEPGMYPARALLR